MEQPVPAAGARALALVGSLLILLLLAGAVTIARYNLKSGRADRRGASRVTLFLIGVWVASWTLGARHWFSLESEFDSFFGAFAFILLNVGFTWLFYLGLEPFVRKLRPEILISWTRLLSGQLRDPRVGRDILVGIAAGVLLSLVGHLDSTAMPWVTGVPAMPQMTNVQYFVGTRFSLAALVRTIPNSLQSAMIGTFAYVMLLAIVRKAWIANGVIIAVLATVILSEDGAGSQMWAVAIIALCFAVPMIFVFLRFGLLAFTCALMTLQALAMTPLTADLSKPHGAVSAIAIVLLIALAALAFHVSRAGTGLLRRFVPTA